MNKLRLFLENFLIYGLGGIISKVIPLIMVPIVTRLMPSSSYFGISDMQNTLVSFTSALAVLGMYDAMYRMFFEKEEEAYKRDMCSTALTFTLVLSVVVSVLMVIFREPLAQFFFEDKKYSYLVYIAAMTTLVSATNSIVSAPTRMQNKRKEFLIMNTVGPVLSYGISIPMLLSGHYILALPLAAFISGVFNEFVFWILNHGWFIFKRFRKEYLKPLLKIAVPLFPNFLVYWVFNSSDKLMITNMIGTSFTGLYSVGSKLGHASQLIYTAFAGGWQYFAFATMKENDQVKSNSKIFEYLGVISFISTFFVCLIAHPLYKLLFVGDYIDSYIVAPYLFLAPLLQMLFQVEANQFLVVKKTWPNMFILSCGAIVNVILNWWMIPIIGIEGAAIATMIGYIISDIVCTMVLIKMKLMVVSKDFYISALLMATFFVVWRAFTLDSFAFTLLLTIVFSGILLYLYRKPVGLIIARLRIVNK